MNGLAEAGCLSVDLGVDLTARPRVYAEVDRRSVDAVVADAVGEDLGTHPNHEQVRAVGLAAIRGYEAERAKADGQTERLFEPSGDDHSGPRQGGSPDGSGV